MSGNYLELIGKEIAKIIKMREGFLNISFKYNEKVYKDERIVS